MTRNKVLVLGGNFDGLTDALAVQHGLDCDVDVRVVSASDRFPVQPVADSGGRDAPAPQEWAAHPRPPVPAMKLAFEKYFLWKARHGYVNLP
jgi:NADH dehydrogenase FAD-containing subunit